MGGCFGNDPIDRHLQSQLNYYLDSLDDEINEEYDDEDEEEEVDNI